MRPRYSIANLITLCLVAGLTFALIQTRMQLRNSRAQLSQQERELATLRPIPYREVGAQFESELMFGRSDLAYLTLQVTHVFYDRKEDSYLVTYRWSDNAGKTLGGETISLFYHNSTLYSCEVFKQPFAKTVTKANGEIAVVPKEVYVQVPWELTSVRDN